MNVTYYRTAVSQRLLITLVALLLSACAEPAIADPAPETATPRVVAAVRGVVLDASGAPLAGQGIALCRLVDADLTLPLACDVQDDATETDADGGFRFEDVAEGNYAILYDTGIADFREAITSWAGQTIYPGDADWVSRAYLAEGSGGNVNVPIHLGFDPPLDRTEYGIATLLIGDSAFAVAHQIQAQDTQSAAIPFIAPVAPNSGSFITLQGITPLAITPVEHRAAIGPLQREEVALIDPDVVERWNQFIGGDDTVFLDADAILIDALRQGLLYQIGGTLLTVTDGDAGIPDGQVGYMVFDHQTGEREIVAWADPVTGEVIETRTGFLLNILDDPGEWIEAGPNGEQFYHYGFSYYRLWRRVLPDPIIAVADDFRTDGVAHVRNWLDSYYETSLNYPDGDLTRIAWNTSLFARMESWEPNEDYPPYIWLPDSGAIDVRRERFLEAVRNGAVMVDEKSVIDFLNSDAGTRGYWISPDEGVAYQQVSDALLYPYLSGHLFNDMEAAIILAATYSESGDPLVISVTPRFSTGLMVPRRNEYTVLIGEWEVSDVILGYPGTLNAKWPHEMLHVLEFRSGKATFREDRQNPSQCEPLKYMMEFMWWVQRYPGDGPTIEDENDWMQVGSGLTLARLLTGTYPNSGC